MASHPNNKERDKLIIKRYNEIMERKGEKQAKAWLARFMKNLQLHDDEHYIHGLGDDYEVKRAAVRNFFCGKMLR